MSSNVGLSTPRGSGTSGYVQRNLSLLKPRATGTGQPYTLSSDRDRDRGPKVRKPDQAILTHDRLREIEVQVLTLRDELEEEGVDEEEVDEKCERLRERLVGEMERGNGKKDGRKGKVKGYQVHELAEAKEVESERLRRALGLRGDSKSGIEEGGKDGVDGDEHPMARQERRKREREAERVKEEIEGGGEKR